MNKIKVFTLKQPWAYLYVIGAKVFETRSFQREYRGELYIHASAKIDFNDLELCRNSPYFRKFIPDPSSGILTQGAIIGKVNIVEIVRTEIIRREISIQERAFGDYSDNRFAWRATNPELFKQPIPAKGSLGIWEYEMKEVHHG
jgi:hypothetical protein